MSKKDEALKLALEALEGQRIFTLRPDHEGKELTPAKVTNAITAIREALAEQPAQQEPVAYRSRLKSGSYTYCNMAQFFDNAEPLYTSPPASKPWVGLTDEEMRDLEKQFNAERVRTSDEEYLIIYPSDYWAWQRAIEAKLREKNA